MTYLQTHRRPQQRVRRGIGLIIGALVIIVILIQVISPHFFPGIFIAIARPFWRAEFAVNSGELLSTESVIAEKEKLVRQLEEMQLRLDSVSALEAENSELKALLSREIEADPSATGTQRVKSVHTKKPGILAAVLRRPPLSGYDQLIIDIGRDYGVSTSSLVYVQGDVLVGRVADVFASSAKVRLFTSAGERFPVLIGPSHVVATAVGRGGGQYEAEVSRDTAVAEGDFVLNDSFSDKPFGRVSTILLDPTQPFKTVLFVPSVNVYQLRWVLVKNNDQ